MCYCLCATAYKLVNNLPCNWKWVPLPAHKPRLNMFCPEISLLGGLCKISHLCATGCKLVCVSTVGYHLLELEDEFINACLSEHRWCGDGLRIGRILFVRSGYPFTDCSLGRALGSPQTILYIPATCYKDHFDRFTWAACFNFVTARNVQQTLLADILEWRECKGVRFKRHLIFICAHHPCVAQINLENYFKSGQTISRPNRRPSPFF